jgi:hypothetical protein
MFSASIRSRIHAETHPLFIETSLALGQGRSFQACLAVRAGGGRGGRGIRPKLPTVPILALIVTGRLHICRTGV